MVFACTIFLASLEALYCRIKGENSDLADSFNIFIVISFVLLEAPFLVCAMWFAAPLSLRWGRVELGWARALWVGVLALVLQQVADLAVGFGLRGMTLTDQLTYFATPAGAIYAFTLVVFAIMPLMRMRRAEKTT